MEGTNMISKEQLMIVAANCPAYDEIHSGFSSTIGSTYGASCENCHHWKDDRCEIDIFDDVLSLSLIHI